MSKTVAIIYGFTEGEWHGTRLRQALKADGYELTTDLEQADIVIAHSAGCYHIPLDLRNDQLVILINPTYWPGRPIVLRSLIMTWKLLLAIRPGNHPWFQVRKTAHNLWYLVWHAGNNRAMARKAPKYDLEGEIRYNHTILVRNHNDPWLTPDLEPLRKAHPYLRIVELSGDHDDCWEHPERYLNLLQS